MLTKPLRYCRLWNKLGMQAGHQKAKRLNVSHKQAVQPLNRNIGSLHNGNLIPHTNMLSSAIVPVST